jgi:hypothetical protein
MTSDQEYLEKAQSAALAESDKRRPEKYASLAEGIVAFKSGTPWEKCPYKHTKPPSQVFDVKNPSAPFELEPGTMVVGTIMAVQPPLEYEKAKAWKRGWLIAYWHEIMLLRKAGIQKIRRCIKYIESLESEYSVLQKKVKEGFFEHYFNHFKNVKALKYYKSNFYHLEEYKFLGTLHIYVALLYDGKIYISDSFLSDYGKEKEMGIDPTSEYRDRYDVNPNINELKELSLYYDKESFNKEYELLLSDGKNIPRLGT